MVTSFLSIYIAAKLSLEPELVKTVKISWNQLKPAEISWISLDKYSLVWESSFLGHFCGKLPEATFDQISANSTHSASVAASVCRLLASDLGIMNYHLLPLSRMSSGEMSPVTSCQHLVTSKFVTPTLFWAASYHSIISSLVPSHQPPLWPECQWAN